MKQIPLYRLEVASFLSLFYPFGMNQPGTDKKRKMKVNPSYIVDIVLDKVKESKCSSDISTTHTVGEETRTYPLAPEASKAANLDDLSTEVLVNGVAFSEEDFGAGAGAGGGAGADSTMGLLGIGGAAAGEMLDTGALVAPILRFKCISKSPT